MNKMTFDWPCKFVPRGFRRLLCKRAEYNEGKSPAVLAFDPDEKELWGMPYGCITVNLDDYHVAELNMAKDNVFYAYIDVNNWPGIEEILSYSDWCGPEGTERTSGFVTYPLYWFDALMEEV